MADMRVRIEYFLTRHLISIGFGNISASVPAGRTTHLYPCPLGLLPTGMQVPPCRPSTTARAAPPPARACSAATPPPRGRSCSTHGPLLRSASELLLRTFAPRKLVCLCWKDEGEEDRMTSGPYLVVSAEINLRV